MENWSLKQKKQATQWTDGGKSLLGPNLPIVLSSTPFGGFAEDWTTAAQQAPQECGITVVLTGAQSRLSMAEYAKTLLRLGATGRVSTLRIEGLVSLRPKDLQHLNDEQFVDYCQSQRYPWDSFSQLAKARAEEAGLVVVNDKDGLDVKEKNGLSTEHKYSAVKEYSEKIGFVVLRDNAGLSIKDKEPRPVTKLASPPMTNTGL